MYNMILIHIYSTINLQIVDRKPWRNEWASHVTVKPIILFKHTKREYKTLLS